MAFAIDTPATLSDDSELGLFDPESAAEANDFDAADEPATEATEETPEAPEQIHQADEPSEEASEPEASDDTFWQEIELLGKLAEAERHCQECEWKLEDAKAVVKEQKETLSLATTAVRKVVSEILDLMAGKTLPTAPEQASDSSDDNAAAATGVDFDENAWREFATEELLRGLKGLGPKKLTAICDAAPTVGELEDLRGQASKAFKPFKAMLPDGFGETVAGAIEDRLIDHIAKMGTPPASEQVEQVDAPEAGDESAPEAEELPSDIAVLTERIRRNIQNSIDNGCEKERLIEIGEPNMSFGKQQTAGMDAFKAGESLSSCPRSKGVPDANWLSSWISAEFYANWPSDDDESIDVVGSETAEDSTGDVTGADGAAEAADEEYEDVD